jgi:hypothetical protein
MAKWENQLLCGREGTFGGVEAAMSAEGNSGLAGEGATKVKLNEA